MPGSGNYSSTVPARGISPGSHFPPWRRLRHRAALPVDRREASVPSRIHRDQPSANPPKKGILSIFELKLESQEEIRNSFNLFEKLSPSCTQCIAIVQYTVGNQEVTVIADENI